MKVFVSWSGELSHKLANKFHLWLPGALQMVKPYFTPSDIEKGARWTSEISRELEESDVGVLFITRENINSSWLAYEAGALSKRLDKSRVCPLIFGLGPEDLPGPLRQFQATEFVEDDFRKLLRTVNSAAGDSKLPDKVLDEVFDMWWPRLEEHFREIVENHKVEIEQQPIRAERDILDEILALVRMDFERKSKTNVISSAAVMELAQALVDTNHAIKAGLDEQRVLSALSNTVKPMEYLFRKIGTKTEDTNLSRLQAELRELSFSYARLAAQEEDDIPF